MKTRLVFMGSDPIALPSLELLAGDWAEQIDVAGVFTQPDRPSGRGKKLQANPIKEWALARGVEIRQPERIGEEDLAWLKEIRCDLLLVMAYGHILRRGLLEFPPLGTYNLHASLLPKYRGASPIPAAVACGEKRSGVTLMRMVRRLDAGPIVDQEAFSIERRETGETAERKTAAACVPLLARNLETLLAGDVPLREQNEAHATYTRKMEKKDGELDFSLPAERLARRINALHRWPGCFVTVREQRIRIGLADWREETADAAPGTVLEEIDGEVRVATGAGVLCLLSLQRPGGRLLPAAEFVRGFSISPGTCFLSKPMDALVADEPFPYRR